MGAECGTEVLPKWCAGRLYARREVRHDEGVITVSPQRRGHGRSEVPPMYRNGSRDFLWMWFFLAILLITQVLHADTPAAVGPPLSSNFSGPFWQVMTPVGGTASVSNGHLFLNVPGGSNHDALTSGNQ